MHDEVELLRQPRLEVVARAFRLRTIDDANGPLEARQPSDDASAGCPGFSMNTGRPVS